MVLSKSVLCMLVAGVLLPGCVTAGKYYQLEDELARTREQLAYAEDNLAQAEELLTQVDDQADEVSQLAAQLAAERQAKEDLQRKMNELGLNQAGLAHGVSVVSNDEGMVGYAAEGDVLFSSGSDAVTSAGSDALRFIANKIKNNSYEIRIDGHTDSDPIVKTKDRYPKGNIQLGAARAMSVAQKLVELGIEESRISIASFGPHKPVASGSDDAAKSRNRRVEILMKVAGSSSNN